MGFQKALEVFIGFQIYFLAWGGHGGDCQHRVWLCPWVQGLRLSGLEFRV